MNVQVPFGAGVLEGGLARSAKSRDFEAAWRGLRGDAPVPTRAQFHPAKATRFLSELVLLEIPKGDVPRMTVRLVGTAVDMRLQTNIAQQNYLDYLPQAYHDGAWRSCRLMIDHPCGLWQMAELHYERGTSNVVEMSMFPLHGAADGADFVLVHLNFIGMAREPHPPLRAISADTALTFEFLDLGAGVPAWNG